MEKVTRSLKSGEYRGEVTTKGNFSSVPLTDQYFIRCRSIDSTSMNSTAFLQDLFSEFEEQFGLRILNWEIREEGRVVLIHHEPKEKTEAATAGQKENPKSPFCPGPDFGPDH